MQLSEIRSRKEKEEEEASSKFFPSPKEEFKSGAERVDRKMVGRIQKYKGVLLGCVILAPPIHGICLSFGAVAPFTREIAASGVGRNCREAAGGWPLVKFPLSSSPAPTNTSCSFHFRHKC